MTMMMIMMTVVMMMVLVLMIFMVVMMNDCGDNVMVFFPNYFDENDGGDNDVNHYNYYQ